MSKYNGKKRSVEDMVVYVCEAVAVGALLGALSALYYICANMPITTIAG